MCTCGVVCGVVCGVLFCINRIDMAGGSSSLLVTWLQESIDLLIMFKQTKKVVPFVTSEGARRQKVCRWVSRSDKFALDFFWVLDNSVE